MNPLSDVHWSFVLLVLVLAGCSGAKSTVSTSSDPNAFPPALERYVNPFTMLDGAGESMDLALLGGLNVPRPQFVDIDGDGDDDLFLQENTGKLMFFEHIRENGESKFVWRTDQYGGIDIGEWSRFYDMDEDGDFDLLAEKQFSYVTYYQNVGDATNAEFVALADSLRDFQGEPLFADRQNIPNLTDIDCDGLIDLFVGRVEGTVMRYEAIAKVEDGPPVFRLLDNRFEDIEIIGQIGGSLHGANTLAFTDIDGDGDQDLFWGDFFEPSLLFIENTGTCANPNLRNDPIPFPTHSPVSTSGYNAPAFTDLDGDGDKDMFMGVLGGAFNPNLTAANNFYYFANNDGVYEQETTRFLRNVDIGRESLPVFVDLDADGDKDLVLTNKIEQDDFDQGRSYYFENQGSASNPSFKYIDTFEFEPAYHYDPAFGDLDGDGDYDAIIGTWSQGMGLYLNQGSNTSPKLEAENTSYIKLTRGSNSTPDLVDIDMDGDLDLFVGEASGTINFYRNEGSATEPNFELVSDKYLDIDIGRRSVPTLVDMDGDGDYDMVIGRESPGFAYYRNDGTPQEPNFVEDTSFDVNLPALSTPAFVDIDGDGDLDLFSGGDGGGLVFYENENVK
ncbi:MAG: VCBS repeat-containing protein [Rhodothermaceae bacterium]|nr:VCBS repeat-containing protein [Rhodothermaceae bacterium]